MFGIGWSELIVIAVVLLIVVSSIYRKGQRTSGPPTQQGISTQHRQELPSPDSATPAAELRPRQLGQPYGEMSAADPGHEFSHSFGYFSDVDDLIMQGHLSRAVQAYRKHTRARVVDAARAVDQRAKELRGHWN